MANTADAIATLPFVRAKAGGRDFWHVATTGNADADFAVGCGFASQAVHMAIATRSPFLLSWIMRDMAGKGVWTKLEEGFVRGVADLACIAAGIGMRAQVTR
jgi:hypothetical protein